MIRERVRKLANPRKRVKANRNSLGRFVSKRKAASVARRTKRKRNVVAGFRDEEGIFHPIRASYDYSRKRGGEPPRKSRRKARKTTGKVTRRKRSNPAYLVTLGAINPAPIKKVKRKRRNNQTVARKRRSTSRRRKSANPVRRRVRRTRTRTVFVTAPRRRRRRRAANPVRRRRTARRRNPMYSTLRRLVRCHSRRRNPAVFGQRVGGLASVELILGGLLGVTAAKMIPTFLPAYLVSSPILRIITSGASAYAAAMLAGKIMPGKSHFGDAVFFGGLMQTGSVALNTFLPSIGGQIGLRGGFGMGDLVEGTSFTVPQNPLRFVAPPAPPARVQMNGISRAFGSAF